MRFVWDIWDFFGPRTSLRVIFPFAHNDHGLVKIYPKSVLDVRFFCKKV